MSSEVIVKAIFSIPFGIAISLFITPIFIFIRKIFYGPSSNKKLLKKAIDKGHIVQAKLIKNHDIIRNVGDYGTIATGKEIGLYEYEYHGKTYKYHTTSTAGLSDNIELYFINNPRKAMNCDELYLTAKSPWIKSYLIIAACISFIAFCIML